MSDDRKMNYLALAVCIVHNKEPDHLLRKLFGVEVDNRPVRKNRIELDPEKREKALDLYYEGYIDKKIGEIIGEPRRMVTRWRHKEGLVAHHRGKGLA